ncbi:MAG TPA: hypothetical protein VF911_02000 [Thermoanaerobaculia bacterium]|jgi:hypothetical protein
MRKLLLSLCLLALPVFAAAQGRETLLTPDGTLFSVETNVTNNEASTLSAHLILRSQTGADVVREVVPATLDRGAHVNPAIAYDAESKTLFVFWLRQLGLMSSQLMVACRDANGTWNAPTAFGEQFDFRENLRIAVTRKVVDQDGTVSATPAVSVHLVWWEFDTETGRESAQYAMLSIENGRVESLHHLELSSFTADAAGEPLAADADRSVLKQPLMFTAPQQDSVLVVFGEAAKEELHQVRVRPTKIVSDGRLRVPVGRHERSNRAPSFRVASNTRIEGIYGDSTRIALYTRDASRVEYVILKDGAWTAPRSIALDEQITSGAAIDALRRLLDEH